mmetsp:Transcript_25914/g.35979  ORF Transcript_25914/g.35979 Transcript_25914/m.35979 type:complete len:266 (+) Transcript_25914:213-1010(+)
MSSFSSSSSSSPPVGAGLFDSQSEGSLFSGVSTAGDESDVSFFEELRANQAYQRLSSLLHWSDPIESFLIFGILNFFFFLITFGGYSVTTLISYVLLCLLLACGVFVNGSLLSASNKKLRKMDNPIKKHWTAPTVELSPREVEQCVELVLLVLNRTYTELREIYSCTHNIRSLRFALCLIILSIIGNMFSGCQILYIAINSLFIWPKVYAKNSQKVENFLSQVFKVLGSIGHRFLRLLPKDVATWMNEDTYSSAPQDFAESKKEK